MLRKFTYCLFCCCLTSLLAAQGSFQTGWLPAVSINKKLNNFWKINLKAEARESWQKGAWGAEVPSDWQHELVDVALVFARQVGFDYSLAGGYLIRIEDASLEHRLIQQLTISSKYPEFRLTQRWGTDQTFSHQAAPQFRLRYRLATEIPLRGQTTDPREFYLKANQEILNSLEKNTYGLEIRWVAVLGYQLMNKNKLEWGLDYRLDNFIHDTGRQKFWLSMTYYWDI